MSTVDYTDVLAEDAAAAQVIEDARLRRLNIPKPWLDDAPIKPRNPQPQSGWVRASDVKAEAIEYLWQPYIPAGAISLLVGKRGLGKSTLSVDLAARVSRGGQTLDGQTLTAADVLMVSSEDAAPVLRQRLAAAGADMSRVHIRVEAGVVQSDLMGALAPAIVEKQAKLVVIDPLAAYIKGDPFKDSEVRQRFYGPLTAVAQRTGAAVLIVSHPTKGLRDDVLDGVSGAGTAAVARSILWLTPDPLDPDGQSRVVAHMKSNYSKLGPAFDIELADAGDVAKVQAGSARPEHFAGAGLFEPTDRSSYSDRPDPIAKAAAWVRAFLNKEGPTSKAAVIEQAKAAGHAVPEAGKSAQRFRLLTGHDVKVMTVGSAKAWVWFLPAE